MAQQEEGWPLGLRPFRVGFMRNRNITGSVSFSTLFTVSPKSSTDLSSSSDLDTERITLGSLIGISNILELSRRSSRVRTVETTRDKKNHKLKPWMFSLCSKLSTDAVSVHEAPSLAHLLQVERREASATTSNHRLNQIPSIYGPNDFSPILPGSQINTLFIGGQVAPQSTASSVENGTSNGVLDHAHPHGFGFPPVFSRFCGQIN